MIINHNITALNTHRQLSSANSAQSSSMEKLSSGLRINSAKDDAAGLSISEKMRGQIRGLEQASSNAQDAISLMQTAEGGLNETHDILQRMRELSVQAGNDTNQTEDRTAIQTEINALKEEITRISDNTEFNGKKLLSGNLGVNRTDGSLNSTVVGLSSLSDINVSGAAAGTTYTFTETANDITLTVTDTGATSGVKQNDSQTLSKASFTAGGSLNFESLGISIKTDQEYVPGEMAFNDLTIVTGAANGATFQTGANENQKVSISIANMSADGLGVNALDVSSAANSASAITTIDNAIKLVSEQRSKIGATQNRLDHTINNLNTSAENLTSAESRIRDVDMAKEMMNQTRNSILAQASQAMLAQSNQMPQAVLQLLR